MSKFEQGPKEKDPQAHMEELKYGRFSRLDSEKKNIVDKALLEGKDPKEALREDEERLARATGRIREGEKEEAVKGLEREMNKQLLNKKNESE